MFVIYFAEAGFLNSRGCSAVIKDDPCWFCRNYSEAFLHTQKRKPKLRVLLKAIPQMYGSSLAKVLWL